jgi:hypothetical protein
MQTMVRGQTISIDPHLISSVIGFPVLPVSRVPFPDDTPALSFYMTSFGRDHSARTSPTPRSTSVTKGHSKRKVLQLRESVSDEGN